METLNMDITFAMNALIQCFIWTAWGFFMGSGWILANRIWR